MDNKKIAERMAEVDRRLEQIDRELKGLRAILARRSIPRHSTIPPYPPPRSIPPRR